jgi:hypothetical protein
MELHPSRTPTSYGRLVTCASTALLLSLAAHPAAATPVVISAGTIVTDAMAFPGVAAQVEGPAVSLSPGLYYETAIVFAGFPWPGQLVAAGTEVEFDAHVQMPSPRATLWYRGEVYQAAGRLLLDTGRAEVGPIVVLPFTLAGIVVGCSLPPIEEVDLSCSRRAEVDPDVQLVELSIVGSGTLRARFGEAEGGLLSFDQISYDVTAPVPEPTSLLLLAGGLGALGARMRRRAVKPRLG